MQSIRPFRLAMVGLVLAPLASADLITWGPVQDITTVNEVRTNGTLFVANNCWASIFAAPTVNGVPFNAFAPLGWNNGGWSLMNGSTTGDPAYDALLDSARVTSGAVSNPTEWGGINLDPLGAMTLGATYEIQVWYSDQRVGTATNILNDRVMLLSSVTGNVTAVNGEITNLPALTQGPISNGLDADPNNTFGPTDTVFGSYCVGTFTRTSADQLWLIVQGVHPVAVSGLLPHINAYQIREVTGSGIGTPYCAVIANTSGSAAVLSASGSATVASNNLVLDASSMPANQFGFFLTSQTQGFISNPGGSQGNLCLGGTIGRYVAPGQIMNGAAAGSFSLALNLNLTPAGPVFVSVNAGETWNFQTWFRDIGPGGQPWSNFTNGLSVLFN